jgi:hypothetical protein
MVKQNNADCNLRVCIKEAYNCQEIPQEIIQMRHHASEESKRISICSPAAPNRLPLRAHIAS